MERFCSKCGSLVSGSFCPQCGAPMESAVNLNKQEDVMPAANPSQPMGGAQPAGYSQSTYNDNANGIDRHYFSAWMGVRRYPSAQEELCEGYAFGNGNSFRGRHGYRTVLCGLSGSGHERDNGLLLLLLISEM